MCLRLFDEGNDGLGSTLRDDKVLKYDDRRFVTIEVFVGTGRLFHSSISSQTVLLVLSQNIVRN